MEDFSNYKDILKNVYEDTIALVTRSLGEWKTYIIFSVLNMLKQFIFIPIHNFKLWTDAKKWFWSCSNIIVHSCQCKTCLKNNYFSTLHYLYAVPAFFIMFCYINNRVGPFWVIFEIHLCWVLDFVYAQNMKPCQIFLLWAKTYLVPRGRAPKYFWSQRIFKFS